MTDFSYENYISRKMNLEQIFARLKALKDNDNLDIDIDKYVDELAKIESSIQELIDSGESVPYQIYSDRLFYLEKEINDNFNTLYLINLYSNRINELLLNVDESNIEKLEKETEAMVSQIINFYASGKQEEAILGKAYKTLYDVLLNEAIFEKNNILDFILRTHSEGIKEHLGFLIDSDLNKFSKEEKNNIELTHASNGLGYDYLSYDVIKKIASVVLEKKNEEYLDRKKSAMSVIMKKADELKIEKVDADYDRYERSKEIGHKRRQLALARLKFISVALVPIMIIGASVMGGGRLSRKYKTNTRSYNVITKEIISEEDPTYERKEDIYKAEIIKYGPWRENLTGDGYIRDVVEVEYSADKLDENINFDAVLKAIKERKQYIETKETLSSEDSLTEPEIIVNETVVDENDYKESVGVMVFSGLCALVLLIIIDLGIDAANDDYELLTILDGILDKIQDTKQEIKELKESRITRKVYREKIVQIGDKLVKLQEEIGDVSNKYNCEITPESLEEVKRYLKK